MLEMNQTYGVSFFPSSEFKFDIARVAGRSQTTDHRHKKKEDVAQSSARDECLLPCRE